MVFPIAGGTQDTSYEVENSLRFEDGDNANLTFTPSSAVTSERKTFTISCWVKRGSNFGTTEFMWEMGGNDNANERIIARFDSNNRLNVNDSSTAFRIPNRLFRDPSAWYHIVVAFDTTDSTADNRVKVYVNGVQETSFLTSNNPGQNDTKGFSHNSEHTIGRTNIDNGSPFDGYMAEFHAVGGSQLDATSFGKFDQNGVWVPKKYAGSHGTNGFYLEFKQTGTSANSSGMGADTSGNDNHFAATNLAAIDVTTDTCTNNFCTLNPLYKQGSPTFSEGNCKVVLPAGDGSQGAAGNIAPANGKWYWEVKQGSATNSSILVREASDKEDDLSYYQGNFAAYVFNNGNQNITGNTNSTYGPSYSSGDIIMVAMDMDNDRVYFGKNGSWIDGEGNADEANINDFVPLNGVTNGLGAFANANGSATATAEFNWGNPSFSISSGNSDANGYGNFEYAVPSGYYALCTKNLAEYG